MIAWLLIGSLALATPEEDLEARLLGDVSTVQIDKRSPMQVETPWWPLPATALGIALLWGVRRQLAQKTRAAGEGLRVVSQTALAQGATLAVIEIGDQQGNTRRFLVGTGTGASPNLVADLGVQPPAFAEQLDREVETENHEASAMIEKMLKRSTFRGQA